MACRCRWEKLSDERHKYENSDTVTTLSDPDWNKVWLTDSSEVKSPLGPDWKFNYCILASRYQAYVDHIFDADVSPDDVWIISYPKSGTTWTQEMVWLIMNNYDVEKGKTISLFFRSPTLRQIIAAKNGINQKQHDTYIQATKNNEKLDGPPFVIKNHLPAGFLPRKIWSVKPKIIYVARNPKDVAISFYHHFRNAYNFSGTLEEYLGLFVDGLIEFAPICDHIKEFWHLRNEENVLFLTYEEMKADLPEVIKRTAAFLGKSATEDQIKKSVEYLDINNMRDRSAGLWKGIAGNSSDLSSQAKKFFRKGETGSHKQEMPESIIKEFDKMIQRELGECNLYQS